ncbi:hypothetical protein E2C01_092898 [Portunus trituberculatus]|uniref:Uncharacterized protein n=1 Tax=Portunus trituberculatus TaxID=210409 RepID=A0A5B7JX61_PORTR|nr:hypothetical protein [Portunus trituberculatus]
MGTRGWSEEVQGRLFREVELASRRLRVARGKKDKTEALYVASYATGKPQDHPRDARWARKTKGGRPEGERRTRAGGWTRDIGSGGK